ncbi:MAG TPA: hypothetical protein VNZ53_44575 [Steroidobacteraceae bacterium]|jgi:hypothetical protein|nr:hypothetical protein [Steroidobacteraceae bacterium]
MSERRNPVRNLQVQFKHDVTRDQVLATMDAVFRISGCLACGIRGIDLNLLGGDPPELDALRGLPGVAGVAGG